MSMQLPVLDHGHVNYVSHLGSDLSIVNAARISYHLGSKGEDRDKKLLFYLYQNRHTSPFEMGKIVFNIKLPIFIMRQFVRHRCQNLNEVSARYTELPEEFYIPEKWRAQDSKNKQGSQEIDGPCDQQVITGIHVRSFCEKAFALYHELLLIGVAREQARIVLPLNTYTEIICCFDIRNLIHFLTLRNDSHAQWEMQQYAKAMELIFADLFPWTFEAYQKFKWVLKEETPHCVECDTPVAKEGDLCDTCQSKPFLT